MKFKYLKPFSRNLIICFVIVNVGCVLFISDIRELGRILLVAGTLGTFYTLAGILRGYIKQLR